MRSIEDMKSLDKKKESYIPVGVPELVPEQMQWFRDAKFGILSTGAFIPCWAKVNGLCSTKSLTSRNMKACVRLCRSQV